MNNIIENINNYFSGLVFDEVTHTYNKQNKKLKSSSLRANKNDRHSR